MNKKLILFDLDGTLLPMDQDNFVKAYFSVLVKKLVSLGLPAQTEEELALLGRAVWASTYAMMKNDGSCTNEERFFATFSSLTGVDITRHKAEFDEFYENEFQTVSSVCGRNPLVPELIKNLKSHGYRISIATNPLFPIKANKSRLAWAGLDIGDFEYCTCYENSRFCKPTLEYYRAILEHLGVDGEDCIMIGNDVREDMVAQKLGMDVFLVTDYLINADGEDINNYPYGDFNDLAKWLEL